MNRMRRLPSLAVILSWPPTAFLQNGSTPSAPHNRQERTTQFVPWDRLAHYVVDSDRFRIGIAFSGGKAGDQDHRISCPARTERGSELQSVHSGHGVIRN